MCKIQERERCEALISMEKVVRAGNVVVLDEKNPRIRNNRDMWVCLDETGPVFQLARTVSGSSVTNKAARPRAKCSSDSEESCAEQELSGLEEG